MRVATRTCAWEGCDDEVAGQRRGRGLNAYCDIHREMRRHELQLARGSSSPTVGTYQLRATGLVKIAVALDAALDEEAAVQARVSGLRDLWRRSVRALAEAENL